MKRIIYTISIALTALSLQAQDLPNFTSVIKLSFNSEAEEAKPVFSEDGDKMYFVRAYHEENVGYENTKDNEDIWEAERDEEGNWSTVTNEKSINDESNNSIIGQGKGSHYYLLNTYQDKKKLQYGIAMSNKEAEHKWSKPEVIPIPKLKYNGDFYDFFIAKDEEILLISIKGEDTKGEEDLYISQKNDGKWSSPKNLGSTINTAGYESAPFLSKDKKYLYFSTNGRKDGFGDADIYVSERLDNSFTMWSEPKNLGNVINSEKMDSYFTINSKNEYYFSSNRDGVDLNIYRAKVEPEIVVLEEVKDTTSVVLIKDSVINKPVIELSKEVLLKSVLHEFDTESHSGGTGVNIDDVINAMKDNPYLRIRIESHTDSKGDEKYNMELSKRRSSSAKTYLLRKGISASRIEVKWFGEMKPVAPNTNSNGTDNPKGRKLNRRTEFIILK